MADEAPPARKRILIVDDNEENLKLLREFLALQGFSVFAAEDGKTGYRLSQEGSPDLSLLDLQLPDMPGLDVCRMIRASSAPRDVPVLIFTGSHPTSLDRAKGFRAGADDYLL